MKILLTGSSTGIGRFLSERLVSAGHEVWGLARSAQSPLPATAGAGSFHALRCDVGQWTQMASAVAGIGQATAHLDAVIACAGVHGAVGPALAADPQAWSDTIRTNLDGTFHTLRAAYPLLERTTRRAKIICFSGGGATKARENFSAYAVAKTGIVRLVENIAEETRGQPFDINAVAPGAINTRLTDEIIRLGPAIAGAAEYASAVKQQQSGGASLDRLLGLVEFLLSEKSDGLSGRLLSAPWDPWPSLASHISAINTTDIYTLRRIVPEERGHKF